ncbi:hypothetical protein GWK47_038693 [Chionoecetes opilio]|uniref:Uncharacterized protein n=1 Tax=Chionoecetes opilio TaxID=41210 RepID=A0A8J4YCE4_CHIOP|nr:hypothetical protein GWK47_038693 [Chionoecetes opilio]
MKVHSKKNPPMSPKSELPGEGDMDRSFPILDDFDEELFIGLEEVGKELDRYKEESSKSHESEGGSHPSVPPKRLSPPTLAPSVPPSDAFLRHRHGLMRALRGPCPLSDALLRLHRPDAHSARPLPPLTTYCVLSGLMRILRGLCNL